MDTRVYKQSATNESDARQKMLSAIIERTGTSSENQFNQIK